MKEGGRFPSVVSEEKEKFSLTSKVWEERRVDSLAKGREDKERPLSRVTARRTTLSV